MDPCGTPVKMFLIHISYIEKENDYFFYVNFSNYKHEILKNNQIFPSWVNISSVLLAVVIKYNVFIAKTGRASIGQIYM